MSRVVVTGRWPLLPLGDLDLGEIEDATDPTVCSPALCLFGLALSDL